MFTYFKTPFSNEFKKSDCLLKLLFSNKPNVYAINFNGIFFVSAGSFCLKEPDAAFLGFANFSFKFSKSFFLYILLLLFLYFLENFMTLIFLEYL